MNMASLEELRARFDALNEESDATFAHMDKVIGESKRVEQVAHDAPELLAHLEEEFESQTKLDKKDVSFLFFATALQCIRQYFLTDFKERLGDQEAARNTLGEDIFDPHNSSPANIHRLYNPSLEEVMANPVPFDSQKYGGRDFGRPLAGYGKLGHRAATLGHDPLLGWVFGTANIATSTLTAASFESFHIRGFEFSQRASTAKVLSKTFDKLVNQDITGKQIVAFSLGKEAVHLMSDVNTKNSLPVPVISTVSPSLANSLADFGLDMSNILTVGKQATVAIAINMLVAMIHGLTFDESRDNKKLFEVKTHKIITYSNVIASASNVIAVAIGSAIGAATDNPDLIRKSLRKLDVGGLLVTVWRLLTDRKFIREVKREFVYGSFNKMIQGDM